MGVDDASIDGLIMPIHDTPAAFLARCTIEPKRPSPSELGGGFVDGGLFSAITKKSSP